MKLQVLGIAGVVAISSLSGYLIGSNGNQPSSTVETSGVNSPAAQTKPKAETDTLIDTETDLVSGVKKHTLLIKASTPGRNSIGRTEYAYIVIRCKNRDMDVFVTTPEYLTSDNQNINHRWGDTAPTNEWWSGGSGGTSLFSEAPRSFLAKALANNQWALSYKPYNKVKTSVLFEFDDHKKDLKLMKTLCSA